MLDGLQGRSMESLIELAHGLHGTYHVIFIRITGTDWGIFIWDFRAMADNLYSGSQKTSRTMARSFYVADKF